MDKVKLQQFEGPLDLLLSLIEERKLDITTIALAEVTEQFLQYIKELEHLDPTVLADFLSIAAKLLVIKSKAILPSLEVENFDDEGESAADLESRLILYKKFKEVGKHLKHLDNKRKQGFLKTPTFEQRINFFPDPTVDANRLHHSIQRVLNALKELDNLPKAKVKEAVSIQEKINLLKENLGQQVETRLSDLIKTAKNKSEVIVTFLALLELIKQRIFTADQEGLFEDVVIKKYEQKETVTYE
ncbi:MAG: segregation/condensation protein A [Patescibacteria group bacterium]|nr:segregation/condensation protein A [Patescibacteria group bacterium]